MTPITGIKGMMLQKLGKGGEGQRGGLCLVFAEDKKLGVDKCWGKKYRRGWGIWGVQGRWLQI